jgi:hypothetical protein
MTLSTRRQFLPLAGAALAAPVLPRPAGAELAGQVQLTKPSDAICSLRDCRDIDAQPNQMI